MQLDEAIFQWRSFTIVTHETLFIARDIAAYAFYITHLNTLYKYLFMYGEVMTIQRKVPVWRFIIRPSFCYVKSYDYVCVGYIILLSISLFSVVTERNTFSWMIFLELALTSDHLIMDSRIEHAYSEIVFIFLASKQSR